MAQPEQPAIEGSFDGGFLPLFNPRRSYVGKVLIVGAAGVVLTVAAAMGVISYYDLTGETARMVLTAGGAGAVVLGASLAVVTYLTAGPLRELNRKAARVAGGDYSVEFSTSRRDEVGELADRLDGMRESLDTTSNDLETFNRRITRLVESQRSVMSRTGGGDLTLRMETDTGLPQFDALAREFNDMAGDTEEAIAESKVFAQSVAVASNETTANIREVQRRIDDVVQATEEISEGVADQDERFARAATEMSSLSAAIEEVAASADDLTEQSRETVRTTQQGREAASEAVEALDTIRDQTDDAVDAVGRLEGEMDQIYEVVDFIREIAEETNLLAVNAQIEAAHAGEVGEGFGIVADQVKSLADETAQAAEDIESSLEDLRQRTDTTTERIERTQRTVERGTETIESALGALDEIGTVVEETNVSVQGINDATKEGTRTAEEVVRMIDEVADISERSARQAEEVVGAARQGSESVQEVNRSVENLADRAEALNDSLSQFTVSKEVEPEDRLVDARSN
ncbi:hypothetical protein BRD00_01770 [Halobacteriales archaeon QS_8_69_26]|nr:MAG: hypothetical protein BRD00_01770 [Halobacteriales archaeon QS_8_69_26]